ncbi:SIR2 family protein [Bifidobacterium canis]|uniref:SIR2-like domain containing protein n=1 Tax=Bifidobacterium canis TaxID=2610880 RepID=A0A7K1J3J7_9BIFI|nr:SIR2 family protein [Bifidobacterium canis]MUH59121.1 SIR2-like domain containing protein [Bifidobacterium canis]
MWITETVELPDELIDAARKDELVLFVGAGASIDPPASLPSYKELVTELAREQLPDEEAVQQLLDGSSLDDVLGKLPDRENAHSRALRLMQPNESHCNETHKAIMRLAKAVGTPRIVTTNYDMLLEEAGKNLEIDFGRVYAGPALPLGSSFDGIVHVHGNLQSRPDEIILDNHDYAKAYLQDSWAARFITEMFRHYSVLFIGYGMTDPIMKYLTLGGISQNHPHFVLIGEKIAQGDSNVDDNGWIERGITPIQFPLHEDPEPRFKELPIVLNRFAKSLSDDYIEIKERIQRIIDSGNVPSSLDDSDFMTMALRTEDGAKCFMNFLRDLIMMKLLDGFLGC